MILASIFIGPPGPGKDIALPLPVQRNIASLKQHHPGLPHMLFSGEDIASFIEEKFPREVIEAYNALRPLTYKADLARYCILYELGGIYADLSHFFTRSLPFDGERPIVFRDLMGATTWNTNTSVFAAPPRHRALELAIEMVCANVKRRYYGQTFLCPTGPSLFGKAWATTCESDDLLAGFSVTHTPADLKKLYPRVALPGGPRFHCLVLGIEMVAIKRKRFGSGGLTDLGVPDSDNYMAGWRRRDVYQDEAEHD